MEPTFDHEKLKAYQAALRFYAWCEAVLERVPKTFAVRDQLERARTSIVLNIAEGNGKFTGPDRCRFLDIARGSALECAACLDLLQLRGVLKPEEAASGKTELKGIVSMLVGLVRVNSNDRLHEEPVPYRVGERD